MSTVRGLIEDALYMSLFDRQSDDIDLESAPVSSAVKKLNEIIDQYRNYLPYTTVVKFDNIAALDAIEALEVSTIQYFLGDVGYMLLKDNQASFSRHAAVANLKTVPSRFWFDKYNNKIHIYPSPSANNNEYFEVGYVPKISVANLNNSLPENIPPFAEVFFKYELAQVISLETETKWSAGKEQKRQEARTILMQNGSRNLDKPELASFGNAQNGKGAFPWFYYANK